MAKRNGIAAPDLQARSGFTLMEILVALAILAVTAAITLPAFDGWMQGQKLSESVDSFRMNLVKARTRAMEEGRTYRVAWQPSSGSYRIAPDELEDWPELSGSPAGPLFSDAAGLPGMSLVDALRDGVHFLPNADFGQAFILFRPNGTASILVEDGTERSQADIPIANEKGESRVVRVRAVTGGTTAFNPSVR